MNSLSLQFLDLKCTFYPNARPIKRLEVGLYSGFITNDGKSFDIKPTSIIFSESDGNKEMFVYAVVVNGEKQTELVKFESEQSDTASTKFVLIQKGDFNTINFNYNPNY